MVTDEEIDALVVELRSLAGCDARAGAPLGKAMELAASMLLALQAERTALLSYGPDLPSKSDIELKAAISAARAEALEEAKQAIWAASRDARDHDDLAFNSGLEGAIEAIDALKDKQP